MLLLYIGNFTKPWCTEVHIKASFESLGHTVIPLQEGKIDNEIIFNAIKKHNPDFLLYTKTWNKEYDWKAIKRRVFTVSWTLDLYHNLDRKDQLDNNPFFHTHLVISPDGGHDKEFKEHKVHHAYVKPGVYDKECYIGKYDEEFDYPIVFVGSYLVYHKEWTHRKALIDFLYKTYPGKFECFPKDRAIRGDTLNNLYATAKIVVGDSLHSPHYWSDRLYETTGRGGFLIHPKVEGIDEEFEYGTNIVGYNYWDFEGLKKKIDYYLENEKERKEIQMAGHQFVKENCTYVERCKTVLKLINDEKTKLWGGKRPI